jgi:16S rRNA (cytidine1402-2'-O)-methyltransferase
MQKGTLYLIPTTLGEEEDLYHTIPTYVKDIINTLDEYVVENEKSARRFLKRIGLVKPLQEMILYPLNEHTPSEEISTYLKPLLAGKNMGLLSDVGCPAVADPGASVAGLAHQKGIKVVPLVGPSSILLALMASGFNGQNFTFHGYLPKERGERVKKIKELEADAHKKKQTQLFIETPYRNQHLFDDILANCENNTLMCIATDITLPTEFIQSKSIAQWKKEPQTGAKISKRPSIFILHKW